MKVKYYISLAILLIAHAHSHAQVQTEIYGNNIYELSVIQVFPDSFPQVDVIFQARDEAGRPLWDLGENDLIVIENDNLCDVLELTNMSESEIIDIALVIDHSGSMQYPVVPDSMYYYPWSPLEIDSLMHLPKPIDFAKEGVLSFISSSELKSDSILIAGFSSWTDTIIGPTQDVARLEAIVNGMQADFGTAYYDALIATMERLSLKPNQKSAIVSLTDGQDNESENSVEDVIRMSNDLEIPIYIIGLGYVQDSTLIAISEATNGLYYKTDDPSRLQEIYLNISRQLKSVYKLTYASSISGFAANEHALKFEFTNDTLSFSNPDIRLTLPTDVVNYIHEKEQSRIDTQQNVMIGGMTAGFFAIGLMSFVLYRKKKQRTLRINNVYPNPFTEVLNISIENNILVEEVDIEVVNLSGNVVYQSKSTDKENSIDLTHLPSGVYIVSVISLDGAKDSAKAIKK